MTKEERIANLKILKSRITVFDEDDSKQLKALQETIKELEQEPCEDAVSRQAVEDAIADTIVNGESLGYAVAYDILSDLPSVILQRKTGNWISTSIQGEIDGQIVHAFTCSECGAISIFRVSNGNIINGDLCPNCGVKMEYKGNKE